MPEDQIAARPEPRLLALTAAILIVLLVGACAGAAAETTAPSVAPKNMPEVRLADEQAIQLMSTLSDGSETQARDALAAVVAAGDSRFIAVLIELLRANQIGILDGAGYGAHIAALEQLSGQRFGDDWSAWVEWYGATALADGSDLNLVPPPGFTGWKGRLLGRVDPGFSEFLSDGAPARIRVEEIQWGGVAVDGIPALDNPAMILAAAADYLSPEDAVFGLAINGDARAYPLRIMDWHEMANDVVGGVPVSLAYCTLCGAAIAYDGRGSDGVTYTFGSSGFLFRSNKLMYDRQTRSLWNQLTGEPVLGALAATDLRLELLPVVLTTWKAWQAEHPDTLVLDIETGFTRPYSPGAAYGDYFSSPDTMFPVWQRDERMPAKARIYALRFDHVPKAYPLDRLVKEQVVNDVVGNTALVLVTPRGAVRVAGEHRRVGPVTYEAGAEVRAYLRGEVVYGSGPNADTLLDADGNPWTITEEALVGPHGELAPRVSGHLAYWFGWYTFFPQTLLYGE